ncbi:hypothetical protein G7054_g8232 [Neopestalotiopsis clavispora]|nr:hypothetical protein G7054_g8232 [Neopestalotiopsis clavispora]
MKAYMQHNPSGGTSSQQNTATSDSGRHEGKRLFLTAPSTALNTEAPSDSESGTPNSIAWQANFSLSTTPPIVPDSPSFFMVSTATKELDAFELPSLYTPRR